MTRKRANTTKSKNVAQVKTKPKVAPLVQTEGNYFNELVDVSNRLAALQKQKAQYEFVITKLEENRKKIQQGKIKLPVTIVLIPKIMYYQEDSKKEIFKFFDEQIGAAKSAIKSLAGQIQHRYDEYVESAVRNKEFFNRKFGDLKAKSITVGRKEIKDEENLFEAEFKDLIESEEAMAKFQKAKEEALKRNTEKANKNKKG